MSKTAIVTGGANGIGRAITIAMAKAGYHVVIADIDTQTGNALAEELSSDGGSASQYTIDITQTDKLDAMVQSVIKQYGSIDVLVNNAGIQIRNWAIDFEEELFDKLMDINLKAYYFASRTVAKYMKEQDGGGAIVCISSANSQCFTSRRSPYNISKAAVNGLVGTLAVEWGRYGIRINAVAPGYVMTDMVRQGIAEGIIDMETNFKVIPMKRLIEPSEIASGVCFLASSAASAITGQTLFIDGGWSCCGLPED